TIVSAKAVAPRGSRVGQTHASAPKGAALGSEFVAFDRPSAAGKRSPVWRRRWSCLTVPRDVTPHAAPSRRGLEPGNWPNRELTWMSTASPTHHVSSTALDLPEHRRHARDACERMSLFPLVM